MISSNKVSKASNHMFFIEFIYLNLNKRGDPDISKTAR